MCVRKNEYKRNPILINNFFLLIILKAKNEKPDFRFCQYTLLITYTQDNRYK